MTPFPDNQFLFDDTKASIDFIAEDVTLSLDCAVEKWIPWIKSIIEQSDCQLQGVQYIFCSDDYLHEINLKYLDHDTYTDIITFPYQSPPLVQGDIFISLDRVQENASMLKQPFDRELARVIIHGILHLCGQADKTPEEATQMRQREEAALAQLFI